eukprot:NODE_171_length_14381_cov_0.662512.p1 type:complete len:467 gc:universal NODE_171_length_14381_cov_0.662512:1608-208(-)
MNIPKNTMIHSKHTWHQYQVKEPIWESTKTSKTVQFKTNPNPQKTGLLLVGLCGNNGSTLLAGIEANKRGLSFQTKNGKQSSNYYGSLFMSSTTRIETADGPIFKPLNQLVPMMDPNSLIISGWDIVNQNIQDSLFANHVLEPDLINQLPHLKEIHPMKSVFYPSFYADNQNARCNHQFNDLKNPDKQADLQQIRKDIQTFKEQHKLDKVIVLWTASTERFSEIIPGVNDSASNLLKSIENNHSEIAPSTIFAVASILENAIFINGSPQNTLNDAILELANQHQSFVAGDDFKSGQTKLKSVLVDFLINAGISKSNVVDDMINSNPVLYPSGHQEIDHVVVIKHVPAVGDAKRAMDEYYSELFMGGKSTIFINNICEDSLLAAPLMIDLCLFSELLSRIEYQLDGDYLPLSPCLSGMLAFLLKAPSIYKGPVINALNSQRSGIVTFLRMLIGMEAEEHCHLDWLTQ